MSQDSLQKNPFYILGLPPTATRAEVERQGQKLLGLLELGAKQARNYTTPLGDFPRDADLVRWAMAELRNPDRRLLHEVWATPLPPLPPPPAPRLAPGPAPWPEALEALGWKVHRS
ncbi:MAG: hypothetical protein RMJ98_11515 [Myxococcales bacterium]|nr:hypothetical protein [Polyangiaceae bacterium]MDW8249916.1 hypothetical protein [Myxococcales bacterium]